MSRFRAAVIAGVACALLPLSAGAVERDIVFVGDEAVVNLTVDGSQHHGTFDWGAGSNLVFVYASGTDDEMAGRVSTRRLGRPEVHLTGPDDGASHPQVRAVGMRSWIVYSDATGLWNTEMALDGSASAPVRIATNRARFRPELPDFAVRPTGDQFLAVWNRKRHMVGTLEARLVGLDGGRGDTLRLGTRGQVLGPPTVMWTRDSSYIVAWSEARDDGANLLLGQTVRDGLAAGPPVVMTEDTPSYKRRVKLARLSWDRAVFAWAEGDEETWAPAGAYFSVVDERLRIAVRRVRVDDDRGGHRPEVAACSRQFLIAWDQEGTHGDRDIAARLYADDGAPLSETIIANTFTDADQQRVDVVVDCEDGEVVGGALLWESDRLDGDRRGVFLRWFEVD